MHRYLGLIVALLIAPSAGAVSTSFTYQGSLQDAGSPANGAYDLQFQLQTVAGGNVGAPLVREDVAVAGGLFAVELDFGAAISGADFRLQIGVRPGASTGAYTTLAPATNLRPSPQAQVAGIAVEAVTVSPNAVTSAGIVDGTLTGTDIQDGTVGGNDVQDGSLGGNDIQDDSLAGIDIQDGGVTTADIADGTILAVDVDTTVLQARVNNSCLTGSAIRAIGQGGAVTCEPIPAGGTGTVTSIATGTGLTGGPITASGTISIANSGVTSALIADGTVANADLAANSVNAANIVDGSVGSADVNSAQVQARVTGTCAVGSSIRDIAANGTVTCETDDGTGTVTSVASGGGLTGGPITTSGTLSIATGGVTGTMIADATVANADLAPNSVNAGNIVDGSVGSADVNTAQVQARVTGACAAGSSISSIAANGTVTCEIDDTGTPGWLLTGNSGTSSSTQFIGTTDNQALVLRTNNVRSLTITPTAGGANIVAGSSANTVNNGAEGVAIAGGGTTGSGNNVRDNYGTIGGGAGNRAGDTDALNSTAEYATVAGGRGNVADAFYATIAGGQDNVASGTSASVLGGLNNEANGVGSAVLGGVSNCAGGTYSVAAGFNATVRRSTSPVSGACSSVVIPSSGDGNGDEGTFVWADTQSTDFVSSGPNQFLVRADGGVMLNTSTLPFSGDDLVVRARQISGDADSDLTLVTRADRRVRFYASDTTGSLVITPNNLATASTSRLVVEGGSGGNATLSNGGTWTNASSRSFKAGFQAVDALDVLARVVDLPISTWNYIGSAEGLHMGPVAEDFKAAFGLAGDGKSIATVDADGVALAAIQGLNHKLETENAALRAETAALRARLAAIEARLDAR